jgi:hypothetical protein
MNKFFFIMSVILLVMGFALIPDGTPTATVKEWLGTELGALVILYFIFIVIGRSKGSP